MISLADRILVVMVTLSSVGSFAAGFLWARRDWFGRWYDGFRAGYALGFSHAKMIPADELPLNSQMNVFDPKSQGGL